MKIFAHPHPNTFCTDSDAWSLYEPRFTFTFCNLTKLMYVIEQPIISKQLTDRGVCQCAISSALTSPNVTWDRTRNFFASRRISFLASGAKSEVRKYNVNQDCGVRGKMSESNADSGLFKISDSLT